MNIAGLTLLLFAATSLLLWFAQGKFFIAAAPARPEKGSLSESFSLLPNERLKSVGLGLIATVLFIVATSLMTQGTARLAYASRVDVVPRFITEDLGELPRYVEYVRKEQADLIRRPPMDNDGKTEWEADQLLVLREFFSFDSLEKDWNLQLKNLYLECMLATSTGEAVTQFVGADLGEAKAAEIDVIRDYLRGQLVPSVGLLGTWKALVKSPRPSAREIVNGLRRVGGKDYEPRSAIVRSLANAGDKGEGESDVKHALIATVTRLQAEMAVYFRPLELLFGPIQLLTLWMYFTGLGLVRARSLLSRIQEPGRVAEKLQRFIRDQPAAPCETSRSSESALFPQGDWLNNVLEQRTRAARAKELSRIFRSELQLIKAFSEKEGRPYVVRVLGRIWSQLATEVDIPSREGREARGRVLKVIVEPRMLDRVSSMISRWNREVESQLEKIEYSTIDYIIWGMPSLGFVGTVVGIGQSLGDADAIVRAVDKAGQVTAIEGVTSVLGVAFDTTLVALVCSIPLMAAAQWLRSSDASLLRRFEEQVGQKLLDPITGAAGDSV